MPPVPLCPCSSGVRYSQCCARYHRGQAEAPDAEVLMRSRYSAFAKREVEYLYRTLHPEHPDRAQSHDEIVRELRNVAGSHKYPGLKILDRRLTDEKGTSLVLFHARVFQLGRDLSFVECSSFRHDGTGWRYYGGEAVAPGSLSKPIDALTLADFPAAAGARES